MPRLILFVALLCLSISSRAQYWFQQNFDGADTAYWNSVHPQLDTSADNLWQIGSPQKTLFNSAFTAPKALMTDTINYYPPNAVSSFTITHEEYTDWSWGILAIRWVQKLDFDSAMDGGIIEFSVDSGNTWQNVFNNPYVYNFYGFDTTNVDSLITTGEYAFSGTDTSWKDIWLCFDHSFLLNFDSVVLRYTLKSDSIDTLREGWIIDNFKMHLTGIHTVAKSPEQADKMKVYPTNTTGRVHIEGEKIPEYYVIEHMQLISTDGKIVKQYGLSPVKFYIDISDQPDGMYYLKIKTNKRTETYPILLKR